MSVLGSVSLGIRVVLGIVSLGIRIVLGIASLGIRIVCRRKVFATTLHMGQKQPGYGNIGVAGKCKC